MPSAQSRKCTKHNSTVQRSKSQLFFHAAAFHKHHLLDEEDHRHASTTITTVMEAEDHQAHTDHPRWAATVVEEGVDDHLPHEEAGEDEAGAEVEEGVAAVTLVTGRAHTRGQEAGHHEGVCHDHHTVGRRREHPPVGEALEVDMEGGATRHREEEEEVAVVEGGARVTTRMIAQGLGAGAGAETVGR